MTLFLEDFDTLDAALTASQPWEIQAPTGTVQKNVTHDLVESTGDGNYLVYGPVFTYTTTVPGPPTVELTLDRAHGFAVGATFELIVQNETNAGFNGKYLATAHATDPVKLTVVSDGSANFDDGQIRLALSGAQQEVEASVWSNAESADHTATIWARFDRVSGPVGSVVAGYGARLTWGVEGARTLDVVKFDPVNSEIEILESIPVTLATYNDQGTLRDLSVTQHLRLIVFDVTEGSSQLPQATHVVARAYLNELDDGQATLEVTDNGRSRSGQSQPVHRNPGTWAITFGKADDIQYDAFAGSDVYVIPAAGVFRRSHSTLAEFKAKAVRKVTVGGRSNYDDTYLNELASAAIQEVITDCGDKAHFLERLENMYLKADPQTKLITMPDSVARIYQIYDSSSFQGVGWKTVATNAEGRAMVYIDPVPDGTTFTVYFRFAFVSLDNDTDSIPIPIKWEEAAIVALALRIAEDDGKTKQQVSLAKRYDIAIKSLKSAMSHINRSKDIRAQVVHRPRIMTRFGRLGLTGFDPF